ncbi:MAG: helix-turn-helix transcriptional regulator [Lachnospiraceae bacterium]|nr:helix-turn-helix domain-containing protein [Agathobacter sp.]MDD6290725.1 helix-turn-helix transcriptional regulator [Lachnospiraceae bacterium]
MKAIQIGDTLKKYRKMRGWTVNDVVVKLHDLYNIDVADKTVYGWESDQSLPRSETLLLLCELYQIDSLSQGLKSPGNVSDFPITSDEMDLIKKYRMHPELQDVVQRVLTPPEKNT